MSIILYGKPVSEKIRNDVSERAAVLKAAARCSEACDTSRG